MPPGAYDFRGAKVVLAPNGRISFGDTPYLAGASLPMLPCMNHLASIADLPPADLWRVGFDNPLAALGLSPRRFARYRGPTVRFQKGRFVVGK
jgi:hypothetical protein